MRRLFGLFRRRRVFGRLWRFGGRLLSGFHAGGVGFRFILRQMAVFVLLS
jgi:hypothetical protein